MDPLTHMLTGAAVADVLGAPPRLGGRGLAFAAILAAAPDLDLVPALIGAFPANPFTDRLFDPDLARLYHRAYTHALPVLLVAGVIFGLVAWRWLDRRGGGAWRWITLALAALLSHTLLDMMNGPVRLWLPFDGEWVGLSREAEGNLPLIVLLLVCFLTNHPPRFRNRRRLGTLDALEKTGAYLHRTIGSRMGPRALAALTLLLLGLRLFIA